MSYSHQSSITAAASSHAAFILLDAVQGKEAQLRQALAAFPDLTKRIQDQFPDAQVSCATGFSSHSFERITTHQKPRELAPFPHFKGEFIELNDASHDILLHVRAMRQDAVHVLAMTLFKAMGDSVTLVQHTNTFKYLDNRDFTGFVDGTENPEGDDRATVALVGEEDPAYQGGSYINYIRFVHDLDKWNALDLKTQEDTYGRTKYDNEEYPSEQKSPHAHTKRTSLKDDQGHSLEILRHSMPFGDLTEQGLVFISFSKTPSIFNLMLQSMVEGDEQGRADHLMKYTKAHTGSAFFAPTLEFLAAL